ncbi:MAG: hypothetical protein ACOYD1_07955 [Candidatus Nanopelagicales bacterium]
MKLTDDQIEIAANAAKIANGSGWRAIARAVVDTLPEPETMLPVIPEVTEDDVGSPATSSAPGGSCSQMCRRGSTPSALTRRSPPSTSSPAKPPALTAGWSIPRGRATDDPPPPHRPTRTRMEHEMTESRVPVDLAERVRAALYCAGNGVASVRGVLEVHLDELAALAPVERDRPIPPVSTQTQKYRPKRMRRPLTGGQVG